MRKASPQLEAFIDETIARAKAAGYIPTTFVGMRDRHGTIDAISRLVRSGDIQSGLVRLCDLGLRDHTIEAAVLAFPEEFTVDDRQCAEFRLQQVSGARRRR
jgi:hypothetical protein